MTGQMCWPFHGRIPLTVLGGGGRLSGLLQHGTKASQQKLSISRMDDGCLKADKVISMSLDLTFPPLQ